MRYRIRFICKNGIFHLRGVSLWRWKHRMLKRGMQSPGCGHKKGNRQLSTFLNSRLGVVFLYLDRFFIFRNYFARCIISPFILLFQEEMVCKERGIIVWSGICHRNGYTQRFYVYGRCIPRCFPRWRGAYHHSGPPLPRGAHHQSEPPLPRGTHTITRSLHLRTLSAYRTEKDQSRENSSQPLGYDLC